MLPPMHGSSARARQFLVVASVLVGGCGSAGEATEPTPSAAPVAASTDEATWTSLLVAGPVEVAARDRVADHGGASAALLRVTNRGERPLLLDLRSVERVIGPSLEAALRLPLSDAQRAGLAEISALTQVPAGGSVVYGVALGACEESDAAAFGGLLVALDDGRSLELTGDGAHAPLRCGAASAPAGVVWVGAEAALAGEPTVPTAYREGLPELLRAAAVTTEGEVHLGALSYDARPIERWRYDACVASGTCPAREVPQPPGSLFAPAVGMSQAGATAFCSARSLRPMTEAEQAASVEPGRPLLTDAPAGVVTTAFRCARDEGEGAAEAAAP